MESWWTIPFGDIIAIVLLTVTIAVIFLVSSLDRKADLNHKKKIACLSIKGELQDAMLAFKDDSEFELVKHGKEVSYRLAYLYSDAFDSLVHSGIYLEFKPKVQTALSNFYYVIKFRNTVMRDLSHHYDTFFLNDVSDERKKRWDSEKLNFELVITEQEKYIRDNLESIIKLMDEELP